MDGWYWVGFAVVVLMVPFVTTFPIVYGLFFPWYRTAQGRAIFVQSVGMALLVDMAVAYELVPDLLPPVEVVAVFIYAVVLTGQVSLVASLLASWRYRKSDSEEHL